nr:BolA family protein [Pseudohongiella nitratireducens]
MSVEAGSMAQKINDKVTAAIEPEHIELSNESHMHAGPATESHFKLTAVSNQFEGLNPVKRHQRIYGVLAEELKAGVHALALHLYTPDEWLIAMQEAPDSPTCRGGS